MRKNNKLFSLEGFTDFILGISESKEKLIAYDMDLSRHFLKINRSSSSYINYLAYLYPKFKAFKAVVASKSKKQILKITVTPPKDMIESETLKPLVHSENKKLI